MAIRQIASWLDPVQSSPFAFLRQADLEPLTTIVRINYKARITQNTLLLASVAPDSASGSSCSTPRA